MIRKVILFTAIYGILSQENTLQAQDPQFSQYYAAPLYLNPGLVGINQKGRMGINYRSQWPNLDANFETFSAYFDYHFEDYYSSAGIIFTRDREGIAGLSSTSIGLQYAYQVQLNYDWTFRPGVQAAYYLRDLNFDKLTFGDQFDNTGQVRPTTGENFNTGLNARFFDLSFGGVLYNPSIWLGGALHHVLEPNQSIAGGNAPLPRRFSIHGGYRIPLSPRTTRTDFGERTITPSFNYRTQGDFDQLDIGAYFTLDPILVGLWYRGIPIKNTDGVVNNEALIFMLGMQTNRTTFGYSFDYTLSDLGIGTGGAHEISIAYSFSLGDPLKPAADVRRLKCPIPFIF
ncbi:type IX secretion system membrane protein, PorP/SprF family [Ekhidna lutea]|uniref:Type IX secretion system membrane protein, PorP/SprF family n=1 Tax=Ekhidna lutea TaxID=447679 RepID=A0A239LYX3_EKHLU|nr:type IX secretion system membrane protein PorP/SprF [Ekhidna lutea]SNT35716.1 type IX secretion system membrane protein, PorP/SprF family [Ekhidna lutea]